MIPEVEALAERIRDWARENMHGDWSILGPPARRCLYVATSEKSPPELVIDFYGCTFLASPGTSRSYVELWQQRNPVSNPVNQRSRLVLYVTEEEVKTLEVTKRKLSDAYPSLLRDPIERLAALGKELS